MSDKALTGHNILPGCESEYGSSIKESLTKHSIEDIGNHEESPGKKSDCLVPTLIEGDDEVMNDLSGTISEEEVKSLEWPKLFSKRVGCSKGYLTSVLGPKYLELEDDDWISYKLLASTANGWLLFIKSDNRTFVYVEPLSEESRALPPVPDFLLNCVWRSDIYAEPGWPSHRITLLSYYEDGEVRRQNRLTISDDFLKWEDDYFDIEGQLPVMSSGPLSYLNEQDNNYYQIWIDNGTTLAIEGGDGLHKYYLGDFNHDLPINLAVTEDQTVLYIFQKVDEAMLVVYDLINFQFSDDAPVEDDKVLDLYFVDGRRGFAVSRDVDDDDAYVCYYYARLNADGHSSILRDKFWLESDKCLTSKETGEACECQLAWKLHDDEDSEDEELHNIC